MFRGCNFSDNFEPKCCARVQRLTRFLRFALGDSKMFDNYYKCLQIGSKRNSFDER